MIFEYMVAPCRGESAIAKAINDKGKEGWEPHILSYAGSDIVEQKMAIDDLIKGGGPQMITKYCLILRRAVKGQQT